MPHITSADGTRIEYDETGSGVPVVLLYAGPFDRTHNAGLAATLAENFTVYSYDRRGHGGSGGRVEDGRDREFDDLQAVLEFGGGSDGAGVYGSSGAAIMALDAAARGLPIGKLAIWEPAYLIAGSPRPPANWGAKIADMVTAGRRGDAVAFWMTTVVGMPSDVVAGMRDAPFWAAVETNAHGLIADADLVGDQSLPAEQVGAIQIPILVLDGGPASPLSAAARTVAAIARNAEHRSLDGQPHNVADDVLAPALKAFFR